MMMHDGDDHDDRSNVSECLCASLEFAGTSNNSSELIVNPDVIQENLAFNLAQERGRSARKVWKMEVEGLDDPS